MDDSAELWRGGEIWGSGGCGDGRETGESKDRKRVRERAKGRKAGRGTKRLIVRLLWLFPPSPCRHRFLSHTRALLSLLSTAFFKSVFLFILKRGHFWQRKSLLVLLLSTVPVGHSPLNRGYSRSLCLAPMVSTKARDPAPMRTLCVRLFGSRLQGLISSMFTCDSIVFTCIDTFII